MSLEVGQTATRSKTITEADVRAYADLIGDHNSIHLDEAYAAQSVFGRRVAHGMLSAGVISAALANELPGPGTIYLSQNLKFKKPVFLGDTITVTLTCTAYRAERRIATLSTTVTNQDGEVVIEGEATVIAPA
ncbi:MAG: MaoC family dehydratase [Anaerolineae bacterium]|nr:MaoC family dehydratase [Anaerolineae bacterium]